MNDLLVRLASLPAATPPAARGHRVRTRARARLAGTARSVAPRATPSPRRHLSLRWLAAGVSAVYVAEVLALAATVLSARFRG